VLARIVLPRYPPNPSDSLDLSLRRGRPVGARTGVSSVYSAWRRICLLCVAALVWRAWHPAGVLARLTQLARPRERRVAPTAGAVSLIASKIQAPHAPGPAARGRHKRAFAL
jgi:hypothetical protein